MEVLVAVQVARSPTDIQLKFGVYLPLLPLLLTTIILSCY